MPWDYLRTDKGAVIKFAEVNDNGDVEIEEIKKLITNKLKIVAITHIKCYWSNFANYKNCESCKRKKYSSSC